MKDNAKLWIAAAAAGAVNGLFGAGGGMVLVPLLTLLVNMDDNDVFPTSVFTILPICTVSLTVTALQSPLPVSKALPYLVGGFVGGILAGIWDNKIPVKWLHRILGILILWGGVRYLW